MGLPSPEEEVVRKQQAALSCLSWRVRSKPSVALALPDVRQLPQRAPSGATSADLSSCGPPGLQPTSRRCLPDSERRLGACGRTVVPEFTEICRGARVARKWRNAEPGAAVVLGPAPRGSASAGASREIQVVPRRCGTGRRAKQQPEYGASLRIGRLLPPRNRPQIRTAPPTTPTTHAQTPRSSWRGGRTQIGLGGPASLAIFRQRAFEELDIRRPTLHNDQLRGELPDFLTSPAWTVFLYVSVLWSVYNVGLMIRNTQEQSGLVLRNTRRARLQRSCALSCTLPFSWDTGSRDGFASRVFPGSGGFSLVKSFWSQ